MIWSHLRSLSRRALLGVLAALLVVEVGLLYVGWLALRPEVSSQAAPRAAAPAPSFTATAASTQDGAPTVGMPGWVRPAGWSPREWRGVMDEGDLAALARTFDEEQALAHVVALTAPELGGRQPGTAGHATAGEYIAARYAEYGLLPAGTEGYFQPFSVPYARVTEEPELRIGGPDGAVRGDLVFRRDFGYAWGGYAGGGLADGRVYWLSDGRREDYRGVDVAGEIVLCRYSDDQETLRQAVEHGAEGLLLLTDHERLITALRTYREPPYLPESLPVLYVNERVAEALLTGSGHAVSDLSILYEPFPLATRAHLQVRMDEPGEASARNVLAVLPGADPVVAAETLVLGAHYDHLGTEANGDVYHGANDDASGVAALLEIARSWQAAGFQPARSVIFAAWDAEEQGLLGSRHFVQHPTLPLVQTVGMLQLDMVALATEGLMTVDPQGNAVGQQVLRSAELFRVATSRDSGGMVGGSDHSSFAKEGVPSALIGWDSFCVPYYHTPQDTVDTLQPERLREAGAVGSHVAMALTAVAPRLTALLQEQAAAVRAGDVAAYAATLDPRDEALRHEVGPWLAARSAVASTGCVASADALTVGADEATAQVTVRVGGQDGSRVEQISYPARFVRRGASWYLAGPAARQERGEHLLVHIVEPWRPAQGPDPATEGSNAGDPWVAELEARYAHVLGLLECEVDGPLAVTVYPAAAAARWHAPLPDWREDAALPGTHLARTTDAESAAVGLALEAMGLPAGQGAWLREGLLRWVREQDRADGAPDPRLWPVEGLDAAVQAPGFMTAAALQSEADRAAAASLVRYLLTRFGSEGLRTLCRAWGAGGSAEGAMATLGSTAQSFLGEWQATVLQPLSEARAGVGRTLAAREEATAEGDLDAFLSTVAADDPLFLAQQTAWFERSTQIQGLRVKHEAVVIALGAEEALVRLDAAAREGELGAGSVRQVVRFERSGGDWLLAGPVWESVRDGDVVLRYGAGTSTEDVQATLGMAKEAYERVCADLGVAASGSLTVELYNDVQGLRWSVAPLVTGDLLSYQAPGEALRLAGGLTPERALESLVRAATDHLLLQMGVRSPWVREGLSLLEVQRVVPERAWTVEAAHLAKVREALRFGRLHPWDRVPEHVGEEQRIVWAGQSWLLWERLADAYGMGAVRLVAAKLAGGEALPRAVQEATGIDFSRWEASWREDVLRATVSEDMLATARRFSTERALETIRHLSSTAFAGRHPGSPGAHAAGRWIAAQFERLGLRAAGEHGSFFHAATVPYAHPAAIPALSVSHTETDATLTLEYPSGFREVLGSPSGRVTAQLVWVPGEYRDGMDFGGRVVLKRAALEPMEEAKAAAQRGAGGLILVVRQIGTRTREVHVAESAGRPIPVVLIEEATWRELVRLAGLTTREMLGGPQAFPLPLRAVLAVPYEPTQQAKADTVVACLPGSRADAAPLIVSAHYDGVGTLPDGTLYPGANKNAAGVAVLLEMARLFQESGFRPSRTIYFVAWAAEEAGMASARAFLQAPPTPLDGVAGIVVLDRVAQARSYYLTFDGDRDRDGELLYHLTLAGELLDRRVSPGRFRGDNTHQLFQGEGLPAVLVFWPDAYAVHTSDDTPDSLDPYKLATSGEVTALTLMMMSE